jgi:hypothetical protein
LTQGAQVSTPTYGLQIGLVRLHHRIVAVPRAGPKIATQPRDAKMVSTSDPPVTGPAGGVSERCCARHLDAMPTGVLDHVQGERASTL